MTPEVNPYAVPMADISVLPSQLQPGTETEQIRRKYLKHEVSVQSIGLLYYLGGGLLALEVIALAIVGTVGEDAPFMRAVGVVCGPFAAAFITVGRGLRKLRAWARVPVAILSGIGLLGFPIGTIINAYILYLIFCKKGTMVFSPQYAEVIRQTPHIKYRITSLWLWILLAVLIAFVVVGLIAAFTSK